MALLVFAFTTQAAQQPEDRCDGTTYDTSVCLSAIYKQVDAELNAVYQKARTSCLTAFTRLRAAHLKSDHRE